jgi:phosphodiesterase/alkaline phosphatase D-like protein
MDTNTQLILANAPRAENWEDRERADNSLEALIEEFDKRLPSGNTEQVADGRDGETDLRK